MAALTPDEIDAMAGKDVVFRAGERSMPFTAESFILSFSLPNFYFHSATAYNLMRMGGVSPGKGHYMGRCG